jgi:hypothetical protein
MERPKHAWAAGWPLLLAACGQIIDDRGVLVEAGAHDGSLPVDATPDGMISLQDVRR